MEENKLAPDDLDRTMQLSDMAMEKTLRQDNTAQGSETLRLITDIPDKTKTMNTSDTMSQMSPVSTTEYNLNNKTYRYKRTISENTGEAQVFLVEQGGNEYVLKLYYPQFRPKGELLDIIKKINASCLVKIYDFGEYTSPGTHTTRTFELMEYLHGNTLNNADVKGDAEKIREIAMKGATALHTCHINNIIHKDIKPGNFFFRDADRKELVLGDFGIASLCDEEETMHQTQQARTPIFSAPEMYETIDNVVEIDPKVDFYSLGVLLMYIWIGENPFKGNERSILRLKRSGDLPYPKNLPDDLLTLVQGLTVVNPKERWGFSEISKWYKGEKVPVAKNELVQYASFIFDPDRKLVANSPKELAGLMKKDTALGIRYLYSNLMKQWLEKSGNNKLAVDIFEICEILHPRNQKAGLHAAIYLFDSEIPYTAIDGETCSTNKELALALVRNVNHYTKALNDSEDEFYIYLKAANETNTNYYNLYKSDKSVVSIWKLIYTLYPEGPFWLEVKPPYSSSSSFIPCNNVHEVIRNYAINPISKNGLESFIDDRFMMWYKNLNEMNIDTYVKLETLINRTGLSTYDKAEGMMYYLDPKVSYSLGFPEDDKFYDYIPQNVGLSFNELAYRAFQANEEKMYQNDFTILGLYLEIRGHTDLAEKVKACNENYHYKKYGPYNYKTATYKIIQVLGCNPFYRFKNSNIDATSIEDLSKVSGKEIQNELRNGSLAEWLAIFYQEKQGLNSEMYKDEVTKYLHKLHELDQSYEPAKRFRQALRTTQNVKNKTLARFRNNKILNVLCILCLYVPAIAFIVLLFAEKMVFYGNPLPSAFWEVSSTYYYITAPIVFLIVWFTNEFTSLIGSAINGIIGSVILYYIVYIIVTFLWPLIPYLISLLVIVILFFVTKKSFGQRSSGENFRKMILSGQEDAKDQVHFACHEYGNKYIVRNERAILAYYKDLNRVRRKTLKWMLPSILLMISAVFIYLTLTGLIIDYDFDSDTTPKGLSPDERQNMTGAWKGVFDNKASTLFIHPFETDQLTGSVSVKFKHQAVEGVKGKISVTDRSIILIDTLVNNVLDGTYTGKFNTTLDTITGTYNNPKSGANLQFIYTKTLND